MKSRILCVSMTLIFSVAGYAADNDAPYGFAGGSVVGFAGAGLSHASGEGGSHPNYGGGGISVGLHRYLGVFAQGGSSKIANENSFACMAGVPCVSTTVRIKMAYAAAGAEVVGTNRRKLVPYAKVGMGFGRATGTVTVSGLDVSASSNSAAVSFGGGIRTYVRRHFGLFGDVLGLHFVGRKGGGTTVVSTFGVFVQSK